jgi:hypothetical protein
MVYKVIVGCRNIEINGNLVYYMYYHSRDLKYVKYDKVGAYVTDDNWLIPSYKWLGNYCGFFPQIWLSRSSSYITGKRFDKNQILLGFEYIKGFPLDYDQWHNVLDGVSCGNCLEETDDFEVLEKRMIDYFKKSNEWDDKEKLEGNDRGFPVRNYEDWRDNYLFVENDQVVVPRLNLKVAKEIICRNEKQKKSLRKMGFIEDRIKIMNIK